MIPSYRPGAQQELLLQAALLPDEAGRAACPQSGPGYSPRRARGELGTRTSDTLPICESPAHPGYPQDLELEAILIDGIHFADHCVLIALGVTAQGHKRILGLHEGGTENATVARTLLTNLVARGLDPTRPQLFGIDGSAALRKAIREVWGPAGVVQRCQVHYADQRIMPCDGEMAPFRLRTWRSPLLR